MGFWKNIFIALFLNKEAAYREKLFKMLLKSKITDEDIDELNEYCDEIKFDKKIAGEIYAQETKKILQSKLMLITEDYRYTPKEEKELKKLAKDLHVELDTSYIDSILKKMRWLYELEKTNEIPVIEDVDIILKKNEKCHLQIYCSFYSEKRGFLAYQDSGKLILTSDRIIFNGTKSKTINLTNLIDYDIDESGISLRTTNQSKEMSFRPSEAVDSEIFKVLLKRVLEARK